jgi:hypothetical protein
MWLIYFLRLNWCWGESELPRKPTVMQRRGFITVFTKRSYRTLFWASSTQFPHLHPVCKKSHLTWPLFKCWLPFRFYNQNTVRTCFSAVHATYSPSSGSSLSKTNFHKMLSNKSNRLHGVTNRRTVLRKIYVLILQLYSKLHISIKQKSRVIRRHRTQNTTRKSCWSYSATHWTWLAKLSQLFSTDHLQIVNDDGMQQHLRMILSQAESLL